MKISQTDIQSAISFITAQADQAVCNWICTKKTLTLKSATPDVLAQVTIPVTDGKDTKWSFAVELSYLKTFMQGKEGEVELEFADSSILIRGKRKKDELYFSAPHDMPDYSRSDKAQSLRSIKPVLKHNHRYLDLIPMDKGAPLNIGATWDAKSTIIALADRFHFVLVKGPGAKTEGNFYLEKGIVLPLAANDFSLYWHDNTLYAEKVETKPSNCDYKLALRSYAPDKSLILRNEDLLGISKLKPIYSGKLDTAQFVEMWERVEALREHETFIVIDLATGKYDAKSRFGAVSGVLTLETKGKTTIKLLPSSLTEIMSNLPDKEFQMDVLTNVIRVPIKNEEYDVTYFAALES